MARTLRFTLIITLLFTSICFGFEIPLAKVEKPLMSPKPTMPKITHVVYLDVEIESENADPNEENYVGRIVLGLFGDVAPKAVENFRALCACDKGNGKKTGKPLCYKGSTFHRVIPNFMIQGGDFTHGDGTGGETIYNGERFEDESFEVAPNRLYLLSNVNSGKPNTNGSQFFINTVKTLWLHKKTQVFGMVLEGSSTVKAVERQGTNGGVPRSTIVIKDSGVLKLDEDYVKDKVEKFMRLDYA
mmetsp:Transcript_18627/g.26283  ORF Transcript_18627/g.26283 Transcript_18627/m.26283 type:complete len:244 (+) Transcript_18627:202-933(+)